MLDKIQTPFILTIFGASGDLAKLKIFPSLFAIAAQNRFPKEFLIVGYSRSQKSHEEFRKEFAESTQRACNKKGSKIAYCEETIQKLLQHVYYFSGQYDELGDFESYIEQIEFFAKKQKIEVPKIHLAYFSIPPHIFQPILQNLAFARKSKTDDIRVILEKPFGEDEESAQKLFHFISRFYREEQIFLLDHYLGKTSVQSILALRHNNAILNILLKGREISSIQITAHEMVGVEERAGYFDAVGIIKDMFQSHLMQILAMTTMSIPITADAKSFHREKESILSALDFSARQGNVFLAQYEGYEKIKGIKKESQTETYFAAKLKIDRESWYGVPIFVRTGKMLKKKTTSVVVEFKKLPFQKEVEPNRLILELQPREMIHIKLVNEYGQSSEYHEIATSESIACQGDDCLPEHAHLFLDVMKNERLHFLSFPEILASWNITDKVLSFLKKKKQKIHTYPQGADFPPGIEGIFQKKGEYWFEI